MSIPKGDMDASNAAVEHAYCPSEPRQAEDTMEIGSEGCESGMVKREWVDEADGNAGHGIGPLEILNESEELVTVSSSWRTWAVVENHVYALETEWCHAPNTFGTVNMECTVDSRLSWSER